MDPDWSRMHEHLSAALPQYAVRVLTPSEDATVRFMRVYIPLGFADIYDARFSACGARAVVELGSFGAVFYRMGVGRTNPVAPQPNPRRFWQT